MIIPILMMKSELDRFGEQVIANIEVRWPNYESEELYTITRCLDPQFKLIAFSDDRMKPCQKAY